MDTPTMSSNEEHSSDPEDYEDEFNCEPVKKKAIVFDPKSLESIGVLRFSEDVRQGAINYNSRRQATLNAPNHGVATAYLDQDESGTWDPDAGGASDGYERPSKKRIATSSVAISKRKIVSQHAKRSVGYRNITVLKLTGKALEYAKSILPQPHLPFASVEESSESEDEAGDIHHRSRRMITYQNRESGVLALDQLTLGQPQRRGCKACFEFGIAGCSLITDHFEYPCASCREDDIECELIVTPALKRTCERCKRKRLKCSYRDDAGMDADTCKSCDRAGEHCIAGPLQAHLEDKFLNDLAFQDDLQNGTLQKSRKTNTITPFPDEPTATVRSIISSVLKDESTHALPESNRVFVSCNQCREWGHTCNLKKWQTGPCRECRKAGEVCKFVVKISRPDADTASSPKSRGARHTPTSQSDTQNIYNGILNKKSFTTAKGRMAQRAKAKNALLLNRPPGHPGPGKNATGISHIFITTAFSHPIRFNYKLDPDNKHPCSWCDSPTFGLWGHDKREVEVIPFDIGYEEISGGHGQAGRSPTRMCIICTFQRLRMIKCQLHTIAPLKDIDPETLKMGQLGKSLLALVTGNEQGSQLARRVHWCSICIMPAEFSCCGDTQHGGCGLLLCQACADLYGRLVGSSTTLSSAKAGVLDDLIKLWKEEQWKLTEKGELRADSEFLLMTGELYTRLSKNTEISTPNDDPVGALYRRMKKADGSRTAAMTGRKNSADGARLANVKLEKTHCIASMIQPIVSHNRPKNSMSTRSQLMTPPISQDDTPRHEVFIDSSQASTSASQSSSSGRTLASSFTSHSSNTSIILSPLTTPEPTSKQPSSPPKPIIKSMFGGPSGANQSRSSTSTTPKSKHTFTERKKLFSPSRLRNFPTPSTSKLAKLKAMQVSSLSTSISLEPEDTMVVQNTKLPKVRGQVEMGTKKKKKSEFVDLTHSDDETDDNDELPGEFEGFIFDDSDDVDGEICESEEEECVEGSDSE